MPQHNNVFVFYVINEIFISCDICIINSNDFIVVKTVSYQWPGLESGFLYRYQWISRRQRFNFCSFHIQLLKWAHNHIFHMWMIIILSHWTKYIIIEFVSSFCFSSSDDNVWLSLCLSCVNRMINFRDFLHLLV